MFKFVKTAAVIASMAVLCAPVDAVSARAFMETDSRVIEIGGAKKVVVLGINGNITITGEEGRKDIFLKTIKSGSVENEDEAGEIIRQMEVRVSRSGDTIKLETIYPKNYHVKRNLIAFLVKRQSGIRMELEIILPKEIGADVTTASGKISISGMDADVEADASSGDVEMRSIGGKIASTVSAGSIGAMDIAGDADLKTLSGRIFAKNISGNVTAETASGRMELAEIGGSLKCRIEYGTVIVDGVGDLDYRGISAEAKFVDVRGSINASTASGSTAFRVKPGKNVDYRITASSGDIFLRFLTLMEGGYTLDAGTTSGEISVHLPIDIRKVGRNNISGVVREGKARIFMETASGNIGIEESEG